MKNIKSMITGGSNLVPFIDLGDQPNGNIFFLPDEVENEVMFTLKMNICTESWLMQLSEFPSPDAMFKSHPYLSGLNVPVLDHFKNLAQKLVFDYNLGRGSKVLDIGANDGSLLSFFKDLNCTVLGVDPGDLVGYYASQNEILVLNTFWDGSCGESLRNLGFKPNLITATAVFYHVPDLHDFVAGLHAVMDDDCVFVCQCVYAVDILEKLQFDHFYHEHTCIYNVHSLKLLFSYHSMRIIKVEHSDIHGGSIIVHVVKSSSKFLSDDSVEKYIRREEDLGLFKLETYLDYSERVSQNMTDLVELLRDIRAQGKDVVGIGAPVKASTLLNYAKIGPDLISKIVEVNIHKIGRVVPGVGIPIVSEDSLLKDPDYFIILAWNFSDYFLEKFKAYRDRGVQFILPNPVVSVIK